MSDLKGVPELKARMNKLRLVFKPVGRSWADKTVTNAQHRLASHKRTGRLHDSVRRASATKRRATVTAHYTANFEDAGAKPHDITAKPGRRLIFKGSSGTVFARKVHHRGRKARPFKVRAAQDALRDTPLEQLLIDEWNSGA